MQLSCSRPRTGTVNSLQAASAFSCRSSTPYYRVRLETQSAPKCSRTLLSKFAGTLRALALVDFLALAFPADALTCDFRVLRHPGGGRRRPLSADPLK